MISIADLLKNRKEPEVKVLYPRQEILKKFIDAINPSRIETGFKPYPPAFIATKMYRKGLRTDHQLHMFYGYCNDAKNFSACWHWALR